ncbi:DUF4974 domain-containing protein [Olivibacter ginsenosidimutans]|uniref:DUF4974 domain-containing protein n=1 Tax=Olivibacter ginsenosidimutans TaxID=1176537 RepID=A0ABP9BUQ9_9SPHI
MTNEELTKLLKRYHNGTCTEEEKVMVESLYLHSHTMQSAQADDQTKDEVWKGIEEHLHLRRRKNHWYRYGAAAVVLLALSFGIMQYTAMRPLSSSNQQVVDIPSGSNRATLKLSNGRTIKLDSLNTGIAIHASAISYVNGAPIAHQDVGNHPQQITYHELETPKGGQYQVVLSDSTKVWLNAASSLRFPSEFTGNLREVEVIGEAYFEIAQDKNRPFRVKTKTQTIQVLGTSFNVQAYPDEQLERTTLVAGKIKIESNGFSEIIHPGYCATIASNGGTISEVDADEETAWKSGYIAFNEQTLASIMRQISRWYNVDVAYQDVNPSLRFGGRVSRYANVSEVLRRLELTEQVRFKIYERRIVVTNY